MSVTSLLSEVWDQARREACLAGISLPLNARAGVATPLPHSSLIVHSKTSVASLLYSFLGPAEDLFFPGHLYCLSACMIALQTATEGSACVSLEAGRQVQSVHCVLPSPSQPPIAGM